MWPTVPDEAQKCKKQNIPTNISQQFPISQIPIHAVDKEKTDYFIHKNDSGKISYDDFKRLSNHLATT